VSDSVSGKIRQKNHSLELLNKLAINLYRS